MADPKTNWIKVNDRLEEDDAVGFAAAACAATVADSDADHELSVTLVIGSLVRLWSIAKHRARQIEGTQDAALPMTKYMLDARLGAWGMSDCLQDNGLIRTAEDNTLVLPDLCRWVTLMADLKAARAEAGRVGGKQSTSKRQANGKQTPSNSQARVQSTESRQAEINTKDKKQGGNLDSISACLQGFRIGEPSKSQLIAAGLTVEEAVGAWEASGDGSPRNRKAVFVAACKRGLGLETGKGKAASMDAETRSFVARMEAARRNKA